MVLKVLVIPMLFFMMQPAHSREKQTIIEQPKPTSTDFKFGVMTYECS